MKSIDSCSYGTLTGTYSSVGSVCGSERWWCLTGIWPAAPTRGMRWPEPPSSIRSEIIHMWMISDQILYPGCQFISIP